MPSHKRITRDAIIETSVSILRNEGYEGVNARRIAQELHCSTQPIYSEFGNMKELKAELKHKAEACYVDCVRRYTSKSEYAPYMAYGLGYLCFAREEKELFRYLYMRRRPGGGLTIEDVNRPQILEVMMDRYGIPEETAARLHFDMMIYAHGLAALINTGYMDINEEQIIERLQTEFMALCHAYGLPEVRSQVKKKETVPL